VPLKEAPVQLLSAAKKDCFYQCARKGLIRKASQFIIGYNKKSSRSFTRLIVVNSLLNLLKLEDKCLLWRLENEIE
jgi:hypothetical protein